MTKGRRLAVVGMMVALCIANGSAAIEAESRWLRPHKGDEPDKVEFFIYILDIDEISGHEQNFTINFFLRLQWNDPRLAHNDPTPRFLPLEEVWNPGVLLVNRQTFIRTPMAEIVKVDPDGDVTYRQQFVGPLSQPLSLSDFPLDKQDFIIHFVATGIPYEDIEFVPYTTKNSKLTGGGMAETFSLPDWVVLSYKAEPKPLKMAHGKLVPGFAFEFIAKRHFPYYLWQVIVPLGLIVMMSWAPFWVDPTKAGVQFGLASGTVLTLIAYRFLLASLLPKLPYLTRMDYLTLGSTIMVFAAFLQVMVTSLLAVEKNRASLAHKIDRWCRVTFPIIFIIIVAGTLVL